MGADMSSPAYPQLAGRTRVITVGTAEITSEAPLFADQRIRSGADAVLGDQDSRGRDLGATARHGHESRRSNPARSPISVDSVNAFHELSYSFAELSYSSAPSFTRCYTLTANISGSYTTEAFAAPVHAPDFKSGVRL